MVSVITKRKASSTPTPQPWQWHAYITVFVLYTKYFNIAKYRIQQSGEFTALSISIDHLYAESELLRVAVDCDSTISHFKHR